MSFIPSGTTSSGHTVTEPLSTCGIGRAICRVIFLQTLRCTPPCGWRSAPAAGVRREHPGLPICFYGLYATVSRELVIGELADRAIAGEYEPALAAWVGRAGGPGATAPAAGQPIIHLARGDLRPAGARAAARTRALRAPGGRRGGAAGRVRRGQPWLRASLPALPGPRRLRRAHPHRAGRHRAARHRAPSRAWARATSRSATPTSSTAKRHSLAIVRALHERFPELTFDCTTKVEHVLEHADVWPEMAASGCLFVCPRWRASTTRSSPASTRATPPRRRCWPSTLLREHGIEIRPSFMPFTPWTTPRDVLDIVEFVAAHDLVANVDPVQYTIRLLVPEGSLLLESEDLREHLGRYDAERLSYPWRSADPSADRLQGRLSALVQQSAAAQQAIGADVRARPRGGPRGDRRSGRPEPRRPSPSARPRGGHGSPSRGSVERSPPRTSSVRSSYPPPA